MVTGQEHILLTVTLDFWCHRESLEVHQRVSPEVADPLRPIVSHIGSPPYQLSKHIPRFPVPSLPHVKRYLINDLYDRAQGVTSTKDDLQNEEHNLSEVLRQNSYPVAFIHSSSQPPSQRAKDP